MNKYQFLEKEHLHQLWSERKQEWENLTGTTTILEVLGKPLTWWASGLACEKLGWTNEWTKDNTGKRVKVPIEQRLTHLKPIWQGIKGLDDIEALKLLDSAYKAHSVKLEDTADAGTDMHAELEEYVKACIETNGKPALFLGGKENKISHFSEWAVENVKRFLWSEMNCFDEMLFIGGIIDAGAELNDGSYAIIDFKSSKDAYFSHFIQCSLYDLQLQRNGGYTQQGEKIFTLDKPITKYIVFPFGAKELKPVENFNIESLKRSALSCITIYREKANFEK